MDLFLLQQVVDPRLSPDGRRVAFTLQASDIATDLRRNALWILDIGKGAAGEPRQLAGPELSPASAAWSADGRLLAYVGLREGARGLAIVDPATDRPRTWLAVGALSPSRLAWSPEGDAIAFVAEVEQPFPFVAVPGAPEGRDWAPPARVFETFRWRTDAEGYVPPRRRHVFLAGLDGSLRRLTPDAALEPEEAGRLAWTPDGGAVILSMERRPESDLDRRNSDLYRLPRAGGEPVRLSHGPGLKSDPAVSPDGRRIAYLFTRDAPDFYVQPTLHVMSAAGGAGHALAPALDRPMQAPAWSADGRHVLFGALDGGSLRVMSVPAEGGDAAPLAPPAGGTTLRLPYAKSSASTAADVIAQPSRHPDRPPGLELVRGGEARLAFDPNAAWRETVRIGPMGEIGFASRFDGQAIQGWVQHPPDPAGRRPLILEIHGGPNNLYGPQFSVAHQLYAAAGYRVAFVNPRGSLGYGEAFANAIHGAFPGPGDYEDLMSAVDLLAARPDVDPEALFVTGGSGGGALTAYAIGRTDRFRAAAVLCPALDWTVQALTTDYPADMVFPWMGGPPWEDPQGYWRRSPLSLVGNVVTPTTLICGEADYRTPIAQVEAYYQALKIRGVPAQMVRLPGADHEFGRPSQWLSSIQAVIDWFDRWRPGADSGPDPGS